jgi:hypothetical protein
MLSGSIRLFVSDYVISTIFIQLHKRRTPAEHAILPEKGRLQRPYMLQAQ